MPKTIGHKRHFLLCLALLKINISVFRLILPDHITYAHAFFVKYNCNLWPDLKIDDATLQTTTVYAACGSNFALLNNKELAQLCDDADSINKETNQICCTETWGIRRGIRDKFGSCRKLGHCWMRQNSTCFLAAFTCMQVFVLTAQQWAVHKKVYTRNPVWVEHTFRSCKRHGYIWN